jgi:hypothetical protein
VTNETEDEGRLLELLLDKAKTGSETAPLAAVEPILIVARMTRQPADWAFTARIWTKGVQRHMNRPWSKIAPAIHGHGIPTITLDPASTPYEIACQVVLKGYWHGYIGSDEPALANASIAVMEHRKAEAPECYPWTQVGISERRYYKLLPQFAQKINGRYDLDHDDVVTRMKVHLDRVDHERAIRAAALDVLRSHGFGEAAARKWLQRHRPEEAVEAWPRRPRR